MKIFRQTYDKDLMKIYDEDVAKDLVKMCERCCEDIW